MAELVHAMITGLHDPCSVKSHGWKLWVKYW